MAKLFNKNIKNRVEKILEENKVLPDNTCGFRKGRSTHHCLHKIINNINKNTEEKYYTLYRYLLQMDDYKINKIYTNLIIQFLQNRKVITINNNGNQIRFNTPTGLPPGSALSAMLFNVYTAGIHKYSTDNTNYIYMQTILL